MSYTHLSSEERYVISYLVLYGLSLREISRRLNRHHSTISREIKRNRPTYADDAVYWYVGLWDVLQIISFSCLRCFCAVAKKSPYRCPLRPASYNSKWD